MGCVVKEKLPTSSPDVKLSPGILTADQWLKWTSKAPSFMWKTLSAIWVTCHALVRAVTMPLPPDAAWPGENWRNYCLSSPLGISLLRCMARYTRPVSARLCSMVAGRGIRTFGPKAASPQWPRHDLLDLWHHRSSWNITINPALTILQQSFTADDWDGMDIYNVPRPVWQLLQTFRFPALEGKESLERHGLNVSRMISTWPDCGWPTR